MFLKEGFLLMLKTVFLQRNLFVENKIHYHSQGWGKSRFKKTKQKNKEIDTFIQQGRIKLKCV